MSQDQFLLENCVVKFSECIEKVLYATVWGYVIPFSSGTKHKFSRLEIVYSL